MTENCTTAITPAADTSARSFWKWFIPPYVIPAVIVALVIATACYRAFS